MLTGESRRVVFWLTLLLTLVVGFMLTRPGPLSEFFRLAYSGVHLGQLFTQPDFPIILLNVQVLGPETRDWSDPMLVLYSVLLQTGILGMLLADTWEQWLGRAAVISSFAVAVLAVHDYPTSPIALAAFVSWHLICLATLWLSSTRNGLHTFTGALALLWLFCLIASGLALLFAPASYTAFTALVPFSMLQFHLLIGLALAALLVLAAMLRVLAGEKPQVPRLIPLLEAPDMSGNSMIEALIGPILQISVLLLNIVIGIIDSVVRWLLLFFLYLLFFAEALFRSVVDILLDATLWRSLLKTAGTSLIGCALVVYSVRQSVLVSGPYVEATVPFDQAASYWQLFLVWISLLPLLAGNHILGRIWSDVSARDQAWRLIYLYTWVLMTWLCASILMLLMSWSGLVPVAGFETAGPFTVASLAIGFMLLIGFKMRSPGVALSDD